MSLEASRKANKPPAMETTTESSAMTDAALKIWNPVLKCHSPQRWPSPDATAVSAQTPDMNRPRYEMDEKARDLLATDLLFQPLDGGL